MESNSCDCKIKHLEMIEAVISRMGSNSFKLKGWAVTLVSIVGTLAAQGNDKRCFLLAFVPLLAFWLLDAWYLQTERKYRVLFRQVATQPADHIDFDMDARNVVSGAPEKAHRCRYRDCLLSWTEIGFYGSIAVTMFLLYRLLC